jgi:hypothetical protein
LTGLVDVVSWLLMFAVPSEPDAAQIQTTRQAQIREIKQK